MNKSNRYDLNKSAGKKFSGENSRKKVVLLSFWYAEYTISLANELSKIVDLHIMLPDSLKQYDDIISDSVKVHYFKSYRLRNPRNLCMISRIITHIKSIAPSTVHVQDGTIWFNAFAGRLKRKVGCKLVYTLHDPVPHLGEEKLRRYIEKRFLRKYADQIIVHAQNLKELMKKLNHFPEEKISVIPHGLYDFYHRWDEGKVSESPNTILFFGRIWPYKGLDVLIKAINGMPKSRLKFIIAGKGEDLNSYLSLAKNQEVLDKIKVDNSYISNQKLTKYLRECSAVVLPYKDASQSGVVPLAYAYEKPVIATRVGGIPELVWDGKTGFLIKPDSVSALISALSKFENLSSSQRLNLKKHIKGLAYKLLSWRAIANETAKIYW